MLRKINSKVDIRLSIVRSDLCQICEELLGSLSRLLMFGRGEEDGGDHHLQVQLGDEEGEEVEGGGPVVLALVVQERLDSLDQLGALLQRLEADVVQHLGDAVEGGETELVGLLHLQTGGEQAGDDAGEICLNSGHVVVRHSLQSVYTDQLDLPSNNKEYRIVTQVTES